MKLTPKYRGRRKRATTSPKERLVDSKFFELPPELRNYIYELVLAHPAENVYMSWTPGKSRKTQKPEITLRDSKAPLNYLKYVNRQLRQETKGFEIMVNPIVFAASRNEIAIKRFFEFTTCCSNAKLKWLRRVVIEAEILRQNEDSYDWARRRVDSILDLFMFCANNAQTQVMLYVPEFEIICSKPAWPGQYISYAFLGLGFALARAYRGQDLTYLAPEFLDDSSNAYERLAGKMLRRHRAAIAEFHGRTDNLRFMPRVVDWDPDAFRAKALEGWSKYARDPTAMPPGAVDAWVRCAKGWMEKGL
ncbi:hypothetical protein FB567DRAFT_183425 [Paraphoma chrysanthemicola]|uniref:Uncharacterized protein n=1 Tax=Paraphoma chrysanthemicola TaxID=798071 RepID=A0A8K0VTC8_9PLEO|nr:hypothetical protein FB567DRAFT_183425 [Paraphoma chrysanthemicola]